MIARSFVLALPLLGLGYTSAAAQPAPQPAPSGASLPLGDSCYTITAATNGEQQPIGHVFQSVRTEKIGDIDALTVIVHQHLDTRKFDMRDRFLLRRSDLAPIRLDSDRDGQPHVHLDYTAARVTGWKVVNGARQPIDQPLPGPTWEGNLWGLTFASLPLRENARFQLPSYQYDSGLGTFLVNVKGKRKVDTPSGPIDAWVLEAGVQQDELIEYLVGVSPAVELGYNAGPMAQHLGGECSGLK